MVSTSPGLRNYICIRLPSERSPDRDLTMFQLDPLSVLDTVAGKTSRFSESTPLETAGHPH